MNIINVLLAILCAAIVIVVLTPNRWTYKRIPPYNKEDNAYATPHSELMDAIRKTRQ